MKIAVYHNLPDGGAKRAVYEQVKFLSNKHEIDSYLLSTNKEEFLDVRRFSKNTIKYEFSASDKVDSPIQRLREDFRKFILLNHIHKRIATDIESEKYDVVLVHPDHYTQAPYLLNYLNTPNIYFCEEYLRIVYEKELEFRDDVIFFKKWYELFTRKIRKKIDRKNARSAEFVVANSLFTKNNIDKAYNINSQFCHLGVDIDIFKKKSNGRLDYVLHIGEKNKVSAFDLVESAIWRTNKKLKTISLGTNNGKLVITNDHELAQVYSESIATICTQHNEPFGLAPIESSACETPVLAVNEGGYKETVIDGVTGFLLPRDPQAFTDKIEWLIDNPDEARKMGKAGREHVKKNFTWEKHNKCIEKLLIETANAKK